MKAQHSKAWYMQHYKRLSKADYYIIGFEQDGLIYAIDLLTIPPRLVIRESNKIRLKKFSNKDKEYFMRKGAYRLCDKALLDNYYNKGEGLERVIKQLHCQDTGKHDNTPFYEQGDVIINGKQVQVKYDRGHMVNHTTLVRVIKRGK